MRTRAMTLGWRGEEAVVRWLEGRGFVLVGRNFRTRYGEIDLVMRDGDTTVFIEVKTRTSRSFGAPEESVDSRKFGRLGAAVDVYCQRHPEVGVCRIDLAIVEWRGAWRIRYTRGIS